MWWLCPLPPPKNDLSRRPHRNQSRRRSAQSSPDGKRVLHPSQPVVVAGQPPHPLRSLEQTYPLCDQSQPARRSSIPRTYLPSIGIRGCSPVGTYSWVPGSKCLSEKSVTWKRSPKCPLSHWQWEWWWLPGVMTMSASLVIQWWGHWNHLLGHGDHLCGKSNSQPVLRVRPQCQGPW